METEKPKSARRFILLPFRFAFRLLVAVLLLLYVLVGLSSAKQLYKRNVYRSQDISAFEAAIDEVSQTGNSKTVAAWLVARPLAETDKLIDIITPKSAELDYDVFFEISRRQQALGRTEEALFWQEMGRFRKTHYDIIRCGTEPKAADVFAPLFKRIHSTATDDLLRAHPELLRKTAQRVLDFDTKYPAHNNPAPICKVITPVLPAVESNWEGYHRVLRQHTEDFLKSSDKAMVPAGKK